MAIHVMTAQITSIVRRLTDLPFALFNPDLSTSNPPSFLGRYVLLVLDPDDTISKSFRHGIHLFPHEQNQPSG